VNGAFTSRYTRGCKTMFMDMDFPHPRHAASAGTQKADYSALVATATLRQATSRTVSFLLSAPRLQRGDADVLGSRIAYFAQRGGNRAATPRGAFWIAGSAKDPASPAKFELPVNLAGSTNSNSIQPYTIKPGDQVAERGTEL
jgi:hypothetical protein